MYQTVGFFNGENFVMKTATKGEITRARIISEARTLINQKGYAATSINDIINSTGVKKGNLYFHFPSKEALGLAILEETRAESIRFLEKELQGKTPMEKISNYLDAVFKKHKDKKFMGGCPIGNTAIEMGDNNRVYTRIVTDIFHHWKKTVSQVLIEASLAGELNMDIDSYVLANHMVAVIEGGILMAKASKDENDLKNPLDSLRLILGIKG
jgi:TetR/AcrR family transcriptional regulator, transcriptional repressor for nem operon